MTFALRTQPLALRGLIAALLLALGMAILPVAHWTSTARADTPRLKAVFIVGPTHELTDGNLEDGERMAQQAEAAGYDVRRVFHPYATWDNVLANIQGANLVVYMGHGYGWPSPYTGRMMEDRQNGMGLNPYPGGAKNERTYYGAKRIRDNVHLAPHAVVILNHLCYASGNAEPGMAIPNQDVAVERADNMANGWLYAGADAVFATAWFQSINFPQALATTNQTMDQIFMTPSPWGGSLAGFIGWHDVRLDSERTPGATVHLDPHQQQGWYRALTGKMNATTADFRSGAGSTGGGGVGDPNAAPQITSLTAGLGSTVVPADPQSFHPNGDGLDEEIVLTHSVTKATNLDVTIRNDQGTLVRSFSVWSPLGASASRWNGKNDAGNMVADGLYTLTYTPRDTAGRVGTPVGIDVAVLTAIKLAKPSVPAFYAVDGDGLAKSAKFNVTLNQPAQIDWFITDDAGNTVRTVRNNSSLPAGPTSFTWDGKADGGGFVADGFYRSVVEATTALGTYSQERRVYLGAFRITSSIPSPARGGKLALTMLSSEKMSGPVTVTIEQPGLAPWSVTATHPDTLRYKATLTLNSGGNAGTLVLTVSGHDRNGGYQETELQLVLR